MKFTQPGPRLLAAGLGTAVLGAAVIAAVVATGSPASRAHAATLDAAAQAGPKPVAKAAARGGVKPAARAVAKPAPSISPAAVARANGSPAPRGLAPAPVPSPVPLPVREGRLVRTGISVSGGQLVFYGVRVDARQLPRVSFGIMAGRQAASGQVTPEVETNETSGSATSPGFHAIEAAMNVDSPAVNVPEFGYYAGPAVAITARQSGRLVHASLARWSANPDIVIFWFPTTSGVTTPLTGVTAYNASGQELPAGNTTTGLG